MDSTDTARVDRLAAAVATMPDGPSRERFVALLGELTGPGIDDDTDPDHPGPRRRSGTDPGEVLRAPVHDAGHDRVPPQAAPADAVPDHATPAREAPRAPGVAAQGTGLITETEVPTGQQPATPSAPAAPAQPAAEPTRKRRWGRKG